MNAPLETAIEEAARLRGCLNDLVVVMAIPELWMGSEPPQIISTSLHVLVGMLHLDFAYVRMIDRDGRSPREFVQVPGQPELTSQASEITEALNRSQGDDYLKWPPNARLTLGGAEFSTAQIRLGLLGEIGVVVVGSQRFDFPSRSERLVLDVAANQVAIGLQQAYLLHEQKRIAGELDKRVAQRTSELASANEELAREVVERRWAEDALRESERASRLIVNTIPGLVAILSPAGEVEVVNPQIVEYCGRSLEELKQWGTSDTVHREDLPRAMLALMQSMASGEPYEFEVRLRRFDGVYRWFQVRGRPLRDTDGRILHWYALHTDIDDLKRAEEQLGLNEAFLAEGQRLSHTGSFSWFVDTNDVSFSEELYRIFEFERDLPVSLGLIATRIHPDDLPLLAEKIERAKVAGGELQYEIRLRMADGSVKYVHTLGRDANHPDGRREYLGAIQDITARRLSDEALTKAGSELAQMAKVMSLGVLTASIAHEVNQPLSGIITNASTCLRMLGAEPPNLDGARETARRTIRDGNRASDMISRLRALFSKKGVVAELLDLNEATREVLALSSSQLQRNRVMLRLELANDLPPITGDRIQLQQVVLNLVCNASDAMADVEDRQRLLIVRTERDERDHVRLTVLDVGIGLQPHVAEKLFQAFFTTKSTGMGIGLSLSRSIIESHHGRLWAGSNDGPGATFAFSIPRDQEHAADTTSIEGDS
ncbi:PAS domain-containing sensor histidine kinase [Scleromatobacter humisilvae]|uniref:histidine kinase n=1 Tax=Scleromatobacter humisilvae TaxID=2897159 RepID=A0A9X1YQN9_9BURK|nr:PAS domain-containing protein [Scleromatobacter humisilvae]MCK9689458.1 PAS domain-containing protein [Scleromatobacter humisilvae]